MDKNIHVPISREDAEGLRAGDYVYLTGTIYTARDAAHKRMKETLDAGKELPLSLDRNVIYYMGPSPAREGRPIGSAGPTERGCLFCCHWRSRSSFIEMYFKLRGDRIRRSGARGGEKAGGKGFPGGSGHRFPGE